MALGQHRTYHLSEEEWGQIFTSYIPDRELIFRMYKEQQKIDIMKANSPTKKWDMKLIEFSKKKYKWLRNHSF